jgi:hypothetical protein
MGGLGKRFGIFLKNRPLASGQILFKALLFYPNIPYICDNGVIRMRNHLF